MTQKADNLRVKRTKILLREALIALIEERGFDALTIGELTQRAMVSRAAFYRNYRDKYDLVEQITQYDRLYRALLGEKGSPWFVWKMRARLAELIKEHGSLEDPHDPSISAQVPHPAHPFSDLFVPDLVATMIVEAITWWLEQGQPYTPKELATKTALLASAVFREASTWP